jgi:mannan endo-1,4-beta-mannosidase
MCRAWWNTDPFTSIVASANKSYFAGEYDWIGSADGGITPRGDSLDDWFKVIEQSPVAVGDTFWSLFGHNVPDCTVRGPGPQRTSTQALSRGAEADNTTIWQAFVNHTDGFTLQYGNPANSDYTQSRIQLIHQHSAKLGQGQNISADADLPAVPCPAYPDGGSRRHT